MRYLWAVLIALVCIGIRLALSGVLGAQAPFIFFYLGVTAAAFWLGTGPAWVVIGMGGGSMVFFFLEPVGSLAIASWADRLWVVLYALTCGTVTMAIEAQRRARAAEDRQRRWASITLASIGDAVITTDAQGNVTYLNKVASELTGWAEADAKGQPIHVVFDIVNEDTGKPVEVPVAKVLATGAVQGLANHTVLLSRTGARTPIDDSAAPIRDGQGGLTGVVLVFRDVSDRRAREDALRRSNEDLMRFAYVASHDLQEPLRMVSTYLDLFKRRFGGSLDKDGATFIGFASDGAKRMQNLVADLLEYSRAGSQALKVEEVDLQQTLDEVLKMFREHVDTSGARVTVGRLPVVTADRIKMGQVMQNLVGNALKFRGGHSPEIQIGAERREHEHVIFVRDNGIGFDPSHADKIFVMFQRLHGFGEYAGTGMGLAICKRIVEAHGGRIWAESKPREGSTFYFSLPAAASQQLAAAG